MGKLDMDLLFGIVCGIAGIVMLIKGIYDRKTAIRLSGEIRDYSFLYAFCKCESVKLFL